MLDKQITFTYGELIEAFSRWHKLLEEDKLPERPVGNTAGELFCNYLIDSVNKIRADRVTSYRK